MEPWTISDWQTDFGQKYKIEISGNFEQKLKNPSWRWTPPPHPNIGMKSGNNYINKQKYSEKLVFPVKIRQHGHRHSGLLDQKVAGIKLIEQKGPWTHGVTTAAKPSEPDETGVVPTFRWASTFSIFQNRVGKFWGTVKPRRSGWRFPINIKYLQCMHPKMLVKFEIAIKLSWKKVYPNGLLQ